MNLSHRDQSIHIETRLGEIKYWHDLTTCQVYYIFSAFIKILFHVNLKHSSFCPSPDVKHVENYLCMQCSGSACLLPLRVYYDLYGFSQVLRPVHSTANLNSKAKFFSCHILVMRVLASKRMFHLPPKKMLVFATTFKLF